ncbi:extracellular solute-binding protein [Ruminiclostridium herbifermentans]|uniref:Extracellular solute-binding protein n=1 Tax=Ruminiclostridium herbifermentans TaxID=2488810 RepID=A0A4U7JLQ8_9FIRM|nr:ABC transporter substrate-binding protein [Ruminiclostridium herbifermentans]QNU66121.1 extracellular solute-binding protein [Ruminiclostridium herbifermentans]
MKRVVSIVLIIIMAMASSLGCSSENAIENSFSNEDAAASISKNMPVTPISFSVYIGEISPFTDTWDTPVAQKITELTGVSLKIENAVGDAKQRISLMVASGDLPDIIYANTYLNLLMDVNGVEKLDDLIYQYGSNIKKLYGDELKRLKWSKEKPNIYCLGDAGVGDEDGDPVSGFCLQHAVVKEAGYPQIKTLMDFENAIKNYYAKHPTFKGKDGKERPTIPLLLNGSDWGYFISISNPANLATGYTDDEWAITLNPIEAKRHIITESNKEYFKWLNGMWNQNLIDKESFTQDVEQYKEKLSSGRVLGIIDASWNYEGEVHKALRSAGLEDRMYGRYPCTLNETIKYPEYQDKGYIGFGSGMAITSKCKDKIRAMQFLNWMAGEEAQILTNWGIEGVHWKYDNSGKRVFFPEVLKQMNEDAEFRRKTGIGLYVYPWPRYGTAYRDSTGNPLSANTIEELSKNYTQTERDVLSAYGVKYWKDLYPQKGEFPVKPYGAAWKIEGSMSNEWIAITNRVTEISKKYCPKIIIAKPEEFDDMWIEFIKEMEEAGVREFEEQFTKALKDRIELWK